MRTFVCDYSLQKNEKKRLEYNKDLLTKGFTVVKKIFFKMRKVLGSSTTLKHNDWEALGHCAITHQPRTRSVRESPTRLKITVEAEIIVFFYDKSLLLQAA